MTEPNDEVLKSISNRLANVEASIIDMAKSLKTMAADYAETRVKRLEDEAEEAEREREVIQRQLKAVEEKIEKKKADSVSAVTTSEKIRSAVSVSEELKRKENDALWKRRWDTVVTTVMVSMAVGAVGSTIAFIWWMVQFYMRNR